LWPAFKWAAVADVATEAMKEWQALTTKETGASETIPNYFQRIRRQVIEKTGKTGKFLVEEIESAIRGGLVSELEGARLVKQVPRVQIPYRIGPVGSLTSLFVILGEVIRPEVIETDFTNPPAEFDLGERLQQLEVQFQNPLEQGAYNNTEVRPGTWLQTYPEMARENARQARTTIKEDCLKCIKQALWTQENPRISIKMRVVKRL